MLVLIVQANHVVKLIYLAIFWRHYWTRFFRGVPTTKIMKSTIKIKLVVSVLKVVSYSGLGHAGQPVVGGDARVESADRTVGRRLQAEGRTPVRPRPTRHYATKNQEGKPIRANCRTVDVSFNDLLILYIFMYLCHEVSFVGVPWSTCILST